MDGKVSTVRLRKNQDRRLRAGHPWVFSNEIEGNIGEVEDGDIVAITDSRGAYLGKGYVNRSSLIAIRVLTRSREDIDKAFFQRRLRRAIEYRQGFYPGDTAMRLVSSEGDFLPGLIVDRYDDVLSVAVNTLGIDLRRELIREVLEEELSPRSVVLRADSPFREREGLSLERRWWSGEPEVQPEIVIDGLRYRVDPLNGQKTGFFLDQRDNRRRLAGKVEGLRVLDVFSYTGAWALAALQAGATQAVLLDSSEPALEAAMANAGLNGLAEKLEILKDDAFRGLQILVTTTARFGAVVLDPPALVKGKNHLAEGLKGYRELNRRAMELVAEGGWLFTCSCSHAVSDEEFRRVLMQAARDAKRSFRLVEWGAQSQDHPVLLAAPETAYLKCAVLRAVG
jgi:23S rRNA (cytosine1962-C5)-methyltransferase